MSKYEEVKDTSEIFEKGYFRSKSVKAYNFYNDLGLEILNGKFHHFKVKEGTWDIMDRDDFRAELELRRTGVWRAINL